MPSSSRLRLSSCESKALFLYDLSLLAGLSALTDIFTEIKIVCYYPQENTQQKRN